MISFSINSEIIRPTLKKLYHFVGKKIHEKYSVQKGLMQFSPEGIKFYATDTFQAYRNYIECKTAQVHYDYVPMYIERSQIKAMSEITGYFEFKYIPDDYCVNISCEDLLNLTLPSYLDKSFPKDKIDEWINIDIKNTHAPAILVNTRNFSDKVKCLIGEDIKFHLKRHNGEWIVRRALSQTEKVSVHECIIEHLTDKVPDDVSVLLKDDFCKLMSLSKEVYVRLPLEVEDFGVVHVEDSIRPNDKFVSATMIMTDFVDIDKQWEGV